MRVELISGLATRMKDRSMRFQRFYESIRFLVEFFKTVLFQNGSRKRLRIGVGINPFLD